MPMITVMELYIYGAAVLAIDTRGPRRKPGARSVSAPRSGGDQILVSTYFRTNSAAMIYTSTGTSLALPRASLMML